MTKLNDCNGWIKGGKTAFLGAGRCLLRSAAAGTQAGSVARSGEISIMQLVLLMAGLGYRAVPKLALMACLASCLLTANAMADDDESSTAMFDRAWSHAKLWESHDEEDFIALSGRLQADSYWFSADKDDVPVGADDYANDLIWRRFRFGFKSKFGGGYTLHMEGDFDLNNQLDDTYNRLTDAYIGYSPGTDWNIKLLKQSVGFTLDGATSSKKLLTMQRNNLTNNLWATDEYFSGLHVNGDAGESWTYRAGLFSGDDSEEIGLDNVGWLTLLSLGHDFASAMGLDKALIRVDYVYNSKDDDDQTDDDDDYENNATPDFRHTATLATQWQKGGWGLSTDLSAGHGLDRQSNLWGLTLMPFYSFSEVQQVVLRYTYLDSSDDNGLRLGRYEREIVSDKGNRYNELYLGYNVFIYGHKLKWQTGLQYTKMEDDADDSGEYQGWGLTTGLRIYW
jgi:phosphate-selective porin OprO/OprP